MEVKVNGKQIVFGIWEIIAIITSFLVTYAETQISYLRPPSSLLFEWVFVFALLTVVGFLPIGFWLVLGDEAKEA